MQNRVGAVRARVDGVVARVRGECGLRGERGGGERWGGEGGGAGAWDGGV